MGKKVGCSQEVTEVYCVGLWKWIRKDWDLMSTRNSFSIGNGQRDFSIEGGWNPCFFRSFNDWEVEVVKSFLVQPKINFFAWEAMWVKALTLDLVQKRGCPRCFLRRLERLFSIGMVHL
ncbi:hypothetical protein CK203_010025 [Vitis vinifera]|uniref:Reverse transcriptase zinc-binding domain-containing protein n=1 Tax=Vitis vinifera TaxID=29760 RepID=A0A438JV84_VITVI|nr:hypothetical protein CK203_010025 [Vitis vinifera]